MRLTPVEEAARVAALARDATLGRDQRQSGGVVHTPPELARFVARALQHSLQRDLGIAEGFASARVTVLDPACGPGAFLASVLAVSEAQGGAPARVIGCDVDAAALEAAQAVLGPEHGRRGWPLELHALDTLSEPGLAQRIASRADVLVILGNPPWVGGSRLPRPNPELAALLEDFRRDDAGLRLQERKLGVLSDLYVRFMGWSAQTARLAPGGALLGFVSNGSFVDGVVHRGMRGALCRWFPVLHVLELGGNAMLSRTRARDDNVFGVRTSVAVMVAARGAPRSLKPEVHYGRLYGTLAHKLDTLARASVEELAPTRVEPAAPRFELRPRLASLHGYASWTSLAEAMPFHREGVQSNRDALVTDADRARLVERLQALASGALSLSPYAAHHFAPDAALTALRARLEQDPDGTRGLSVRALAYRRGELRWFAPIAPLCHRPRSALLAAFDQESLALVSVRKDRGSAPWDHVDLVSAVPDNCYLSARSSCRTRAFPVRDPSGGANLDGTFAAALAERCARAPTAHEFVHYAYAVLSSQPYRRAFDAELHLDYPRLPLPRSDAEFSTLAALGAQLSPLHSQPVVPAELAQALDSTVEQLLLHAGGEG